MSERERGERSDRKDRDFSLLVLLFLFVQTRRVLVFFFFRVVLVPICVFWLVASLLGCFSPMLLRVDGNEKELEGHVFGRENERIPVKRRIVWAGAPCCASLGRLGIAWNGPRRSLGPSDKDAA